PTGFPTLAGWNWCPARPVPPSPPGGRAPRSTPHAPRPSTAARRSRSICSPVEPVEPAEPAEPAEPVEPVEPVRCRRRVSAGGTALAPVPCRGHGAVMAVCPFRETDHHRWGGPEDHENDAVDDREDEDDDGRAARGRIARLACTGH